MRLKTYYLPRGAFSLDVMADLVFSELVAFARSSSVHRISHSRVLSAGKSLIL